MFTRRAGLNPLSKALRASGRELMLWFETERVYRGMPWHIEPSQWLLDISWDSLLLNLGNPEALKFLADFICDRITEFRLVCQRGNKLTQDGIVCVLNRARDRGFGSSNPRRPEIQANHITWKTT